MPHEWQYLGGPSSEAIVRIGLIVGSIIDVDLESGSMNPNQRQIFQVKRVESDPVSRMVVVAAAQDTAINAQEIGCVGKVQPSLANFLCRLIDESQVIIKVAIPVLNKEYSERHYQWPSLFFISATLRKVKSVSKSISSAKLDFVSCEDYGGGILERVISSRNRDSTKSRMDSSFIWVRRTGYELKLKYMATPEDLASKIHQLQLHQKEALGWMIHRENSFALPPLWEEDGEGTYENILRPTLKTRTRPLSLKGGIFFDGVDLRNIYTMAALVNVNRPSYFMGGTAEGCKETLIICPVLEIALWLNHMQQFGTLNVLHFDPQNVDENVNFHDYDVVLMSETVFEAQKKIVKKEEWLRIIVYHKYLSGLTLQGINSLRGIKTEIKWIFCDILNADDFESVYRAIKFLEIDHLDTKDGWEDCVMKSNDPLNTIARNIGRDILREG